MNPDSGSRSWYGGKNSLVRPNDRRIRLDPDSSKLVGKIKLMVYLQQMKHILFVGENTASTNNIKMSQAIQNKITVCPFGRNRFCTQAWENGAQWFTESKRSGWKIYVQPIGMLGQKRYPLLLTNEIHKGWHLCKEGGHTSVYLQVKKIQVLNK